MNIHEPIYVSALKGGSHDAFAALYGKYADRIFSFAIKQTKNRTAAQDIVQETFMLLWKNRASLDPTKNVQSLLFTIARNAIIDTFRKQVAEVSFEKYLEYCEKKDTASTVEEQLYYDEFLDRLQQSKQQLSRRECEIFEMSREEHMTVKDIAGMLHLSQQTVKNYLSSSLKVFRKTLLEKHV
ncbi:MAG: sigma-70 family RNA polymerase sigma factor [Prevotella sp.]|nr:sigma-70 family RNA polymerase sigma factor [Prevotella sp.]